VHQVTRPRYSVYQQPQEQENLLSRIPLQNEPNISLLQHFSLSGAALNAAHFLESSVPSSGSSLAEISALETRLGG